VNPVVALHPTPLDPPCWAVRTVTEEGGITHERRATVVAATRQWTGLGWALVPASTSLSTTDTVNETGWSRPSPTIIVEGGPYPLDSARRLRDALDELLQIADLPHGRQHPQIA
jgi:hypothetical protein